MCNSPGLGRSLGFLKRVRAKHQENGVRKEGSKMRVDSDPFAQPRKSGSRKKS